MRVLLGEARVLLGMSQKDFGYAVGSSHRTAVRWDAGRSEPARHHLESLAKLLHPESPPLAAEIALAIGETLESLGLEAPAPPASPPPPPPLPPPGPIAREADLIDALVLVAVEHSGILPGAVRPWLHAVFKRAIELGLTPEAVEKGLRPAPPAAPDKEQSRRPRSASRGA
jgi:transcriptional regulator with XRE-family HTH domain